jgi:hypothetical protein
MHLAKCMKKTMKKASREHMHITPFEKQEGKEARASHCTSPGHL